MRNRWIVAAFSGFMLACALFAVEQHKHAEAVRQLAADIAAVSQTDSGYGTEAQPSNAYDGGADWKAYCYQQRESLIAEAREAAN